MKVGTTKTKKTEIIKGHRQEACFRMAHEYFVKYSLGYCQKGYKPKHTCLERASNILQSVCTVFVGRLL